MDSKYTSCVLYKWRIIHWEHKPNEKMPFFEGVLHFQAWYKALEEKKSSEIWFVSFFKIQLFVIKDVFIYSIYFRRKHRWDMTFGWYIQHIWEVFTTNLSLEVHNFGCINYSDMCTMTCSPPSQFRSPYILFPSQLNYLAHDIIPLH